MHRSPITTHVLDTARGKPAKGVRVTLEKQVEGQYEQLAEAQTDGDGRIMNLLAEEKLAAGIYRLTFYTKEYQLSQNSKSFYPHVIIVFEIAEAGEHYHVPLLLSQYGYSTYRGS